MGTLLKRSARPTRSGTETFTWLFCDNRKNSAIFVEKTPILVYKTEFGEGEALGVCSQALEQPKTLFPSLVVRNITAKLFLTFPNRN